jgi:hypothetical protein
MLSFADTCSRHSFQDELWEVMLLSNNTVSFSHVYYAAWFAGML